MKKTWKLWRNRKFEVPPSACLKFVLYCPIASKNMDLWMKTRKQNKERDTIPFYQVMESNNNPLSSSKIIQETIQKHETSISSKAYMTIYCFYHQVQPCLQWNSLEYIGSSEENLLVQLAISLAYPKYLILSLRLCKAQGTKYLIKYLKNAKKGKYIDFS